MKKRLGIISLFLVLFIAFITIWNYSYQEGLEESYIPIEESSTETFIPLESGVFKRSGLALEYANMPVDEEHQRSLDTYYDNRAYPGAPPSIPHPVKEEMSLGANTCLQCHENGGFVTKFNAYAPVTPHPEMVNCRQCHVVQNTETLFTENGFAKAHAPKVGMNNALPGSPPMIPHQIQMRENCLSCHAGPAAPKEIRVSHPERINCRQCHVPKDKTVTDIEVFTRANSIENE
ncbi:cytochrome c-type protein NapB [Aquimarina sp. EL_43]|uniref:nitrate reductase cytochrome c-type subunit n=1 Tax=unclassified Aquimarina TaxID=2627091 RepID=UPI0018CB080E|nr:MULTISPECIES: nitrate reductase cytochrome c-type subunit [unclassified Aquimarina]MBG6131847.1 cytochrome c-type protein NapB [Aquimarina sp. EL_35]MBG6149411.1 cytochrome c-type protein NapB [Aquimarina sp. EL_32]MBG6170326.1 cytochrome c-type protein NapB [Aquimarina sp. EL_43]